MKKKIQKKIQKKKNRRIEEGSEARQSSCERPYPPRPNRLLLLHDSEI